MSLIKYFVIKLLIDVPLLISLAKEIHSKYDMSTTPYMNEEYQCLN